MKTKFTAFLIALVAACIPANGAESGAESVIRANTSFAPKFLHELARSESEDENMLFSPLSISCAMAMTMEGADGGTATQISETLGLGGMKSAASEFSAIMGSLQSGEPQLEIANALVMTGGGKPKEGYRDMIAKDFKAEIFEGDLEGINAWVKGKTRGKIPKILDSLDEQQIFAILNAVYFKGRWETPFDAGRTRDASFFAGRAGGECQVRMMMRSGDFRLLQGQGFRAISLPYKGEGRRWSMVVILPDGRDGLAATEARLEGAELGKVLSDVSSVKTEKVDVFLPKFRVESEYDLVPAFKSLGVMDAFSPKDADFSGIYGEAGDIFVGKIIHKAYIEVDEEKTEAAAATEVLLAPTGMSIPSAEFRADHPFIFALYDEDSKTVLFLGRMVDPKG